MGCNFGIDRTNLALTFNYLLNPKAETPPQIISWDEFKPKNLLNRTIGMINKYYQGGIPTDITKNTEFDEVLQQHDDFCVFN